MKIIEPSAELCDFVDTEDVMKKLEACGRVSRQSGGRPLYTYGAKKRTEEFVRMLIKRGHESVLEHVSLTFRIICDRAIMTELTRHRHASFTVESTRYVKYEEIEVIQPIAHIPINIEDWEKSIRQAHQSYIFMLSGGCPPEQARAVLPNCLACELYMTANLRSWRHILKLRTDKAAHPQMRQVMNQVLDIFKEKLPVIVEDINYDS